MNKIAIAGLAMATLGLATTANAEYTKPMGLSVRAGIFFTGSNQARQAEGRNWFVMGAEYKLGDLNWGAKEGFVGSYSLSIDFYQKGNFGNVPVTLNYVGRQNQFYFTAGVGVGFARTPDLLGGSDTNTEFAYQFGLGYDFNRFSTPLFVEAKFFGSNEARVNGFAIMGGIRF